LLQNCGCGKKSSISKQICNPDRSEGQWRDLLFSQPPQKATLAYS
jgi:hypothetical protein